MPKRKAVVIGSGPNGLAAAIVLAQEGLEVEVRETDAIPGGAATTRELTLPGFHHDLGSAVHPMAVSSTFFASLKLENFGLKWIYPPASLAHPFDDGTAVTLERDVVSTASQFGRDARSYRRFLEPFVENWPALFKETFRPLGFTREPFLVGRFGFWAVQPCTVAMKTLFRDKRARALFSGSVAHGCVKLEDLLSTAFGITLNAAGHAVGWPIPEGGSQSISNALVRVLKSFGGRIVTEKPVTDLNELGSPDLTLCDVSPHQFLAIASDRLRVSFRKLLSHYKYGPGAFKVDWALREPIPWRAKECLRAATVHLGATMEEIAASERLAADGKPPERPFVLLVQPSLFDATRAPAGKHTAWAYCHVPNGWAGSALKQIEDQIERFAPGFRECILARAVHDPQQLQAWNQNLVGGDVVGGSMNLEQVMFRPTWRRYGTPLRGVYLCSSSTPPGGSVHGMCGYWAAKRALRYLRKRR